MTMGIWMWSEPFITTDKDGKEVAVILLDTQGTFDHKTNSAVNSFIFGFSMAISSVMMYNIKDRITSQDLDTLLVFAHCFHELFDTYQSLKFVVRDWLHPVTYPFGSVGGQRMIESIGLVEDDKSGGISYEINEDKRQVINGLFGSISCCLLPFPGVTVMAAQGTVKSDEIDVLFKHEVTKLCKELFVDNLVIRENDGTPWTAETVVARFDEMCTAQEEGRTVDGGTHVGGLSKNLANAACKVALKMYEQNVLEACYKERQKSKDICVEETFLDENHAKLRQEAVKFFQKKVMRFGKFEKVVAELESNIEKFYHKEISLNRERIGRKMEQERRRQANEELERERHRAEKAEVERQAAEMASLRIAEEVAMTREQLVKSEQERKKWMAEKEAEERRRQEELLMRLEQECINRHEQEEELRRYQEEYDRVQREAKARIHGKKIESGCGIL